MAKIETPEQRALRLDKERLKRQEKKQNETSKAKEIIRNKQRLRVKQETPEQRALRLQRNKDRYLKFKKHETEDQHKARLNDINEKNKKRIASETEEQRANRLETQREREYRSRAKETKEQNLKRLENQRKREQQTRINETEKQRFKRLHNKREIAQQSRSNESQEQYAKRLKANKERNQQSRSNESEEQYAKRVEANRERNLNSRSVGKRIVEVLKTAIDTFCDQVCEICQRKCYPQQITTFRIIKIPDFLPDELKNKSDLIVCHRCKAHLCKTKTYPPSKAFWNNLDPGKFPEVIKVFSEAERLMLSRIIPFVKIVKLSGVCGQYGFRGQAVLLAQDIFEINETPPTKLPRSSNDIGMVVITEHLDNFNKTREFIINRDHLYAAFKWFIENYLLFNDVVVDFKAKTCQENIFTVVEP